MKKKFVKPDLESEDYTGDDCYFNMYELKHHLGIEINESQKGPALYTKANPIDSISVVGVSATSQITINFGNFAHIHLEKEQLKAFIEGINKVYQTISFNEYSIYCKKCDLKKSYKTEERFLLDDNLPSNCPKCGNKILSIDVK